MKITELRNQHLKAEKVQILVQPENNGEPKMEEGFRLSFTDRATGDTIWLSFDKAARDELVRQLTGGIVLAGGELPKLP